MEMWRAILPFPRYSVSNLGRVRNEDTGRYMSLLINQHGVPNVGLTKNRTQYKRSVTLLVANAFLPKPPQATFNTPINLDGDRTNNEVDNLAWRPRWFAIKYYHQFDEAHEESFATPIEEINTGECFPSSMAAAMKYGLLDSEIRMAAVNRTYVWPTFQMFRAIW